MRAPGAGEGDVSSAAVRIIVAHSAPSAVNRRRAATSSGSRRASRSLSASGPCAFASGEVPRTPSATTLHHGLSASVAICETAMPVSSNAVWPAARIQIFQAGQHPEPAPAVGGTHCTRCSGRPAAAGSGCQRLSVKAAQPAIDRRPELAIAILAEARHHDRHTCSRP